MDFAIRQAASEECEAALALALRRDAQHAIGLLRAGQLDPRGIWVAHQAGRMIGAQVCLPLGGAAVLFWQPACELLHPLRRSVLNALVRAGLDWSARLGARLAEVMLPLEAPAGESTAAPFLENGFRTITTLVEYSHGLQSIPPLGAGAPPLRLQSFSDQIRVAFGATLLKTYEQTLDCPELNGVRTVQQILDGHRAAGRDRPELWWLAYLGNHPVGVVLLTEMYHHLDWELSYLGVTPAARRTGIGRTLVLLALQTAQRQAVSRMLVAVDQRNLPARKLYEALGFREETREMVYLYFF